MALMECPHCGEQISDKAGRCPHCGREVCHTNEEMEAAMLRNCAECGACIPEGAEECPYCGCPVNEKTYSGANETDCDMTGRDAGNAASEEAEQILPCPVPGSGQENVLPDEKNTGHKKKLALMIESILNDPKKKRGAVLLALAAIVLLYAAIPSARCKHEWQPATCAVPQTCVKCGKTKGAPLKHQWEDTDAASVKICAVCGKVKGLPSDVGDDPLSGFWLWTGVGDTDSGKIYPVDESMIILFEATTGTVFLDDLMIDFTYSISSVDEDSICYALKADSGGSLLVVYGYGTDLPSAIYHKLVMITDEGSVAVFSKYDP